VGQIPAGDAQALTNAEKAASTYSWIQAARPAIPGISWRESLSELGIVKAWPIVRTRAREVTKSEPDRMFFKVPGLRNIGKPGPIFTTAKWTLDDAVSRMSEYQLGKQLDAARFNRSLLDEVSDGRNSAEYVKPPVLPKSTAKRQSRI